VNLSYDITKTTRKTLPFSSLRIFIYANNIGILWKANHDGLDPDAVPSEGDINTIPNPRSIAIGLKGTF
jgi:hypothetical protein